MARGQLVAADRKRYIVILTDGYPDAPESAVEQALAAREAGDRDRRDRHRRRRPRLPPAAGQQRAGFDLRPQRRAGSDLRPHRPGDRRGRPRPARLVMSRATLPGPISPAPAPTPPPLAGAAAKVRGGRANLRQAYDLAIMGGLGALFGLYLYVELVQAESVYVRDAWPAC